MNKSIFNPDQQQTDLSSKIVAGLERVSGAFRSLSWEKAKLVGLSPIQIQILIFIAYHRKELSNVSHLAKEFNITKPTISDAVKVLEKKKMIEKEFSPSDKRSYVIGLSPVGETIVSETDNFANPVRTGINRMEQEGLESLFDTIAQLVYQLNRKNILVEQRACLGCKFHQKTSATNHCSRLEIEFPDKDIRLDCPVYQSKTD